MKYKHSESFARLKGIKESIEGNLTSFQYLSALDTLIYNSLFAVIDATKYADVFLAKVLAWQATNPKRKASGVGRHVLTSYIMLFFLMESTEKKIATLRRAKLDRGILVELVRRWLAIAQEYEKISNQTTITQEDQLRMQEIELVACLKHSHSMYGAIAQAKYWYHHTENLKTMILEKYTRLCLNKAQQDYVQLGHKIELEEAIQVYLMTASKAIDRCDTERGVLTTHIQNWLKSAKNQVTANYVNGVAFQTPNPAKAQIESLGTTVPLEDLDDHAQEDDTTVNERDDRIDRVRKLGRIFDPDGYARLMLGITEILTKTEKARLYEVRKQTVNV